MDLGYELVIIKRAKQGNAEAWSVLFKWNFKPVYNLCLQLAMKHNNDAEDIAQQTFIIAAKRINKFDPHKGSFRLWLFGIAKNCYMKHTSKKIRHAHFDINNPSMQSLAEPNAKCPEVILVLETLARLSAKYCIVLEAKYLEKKTVNEIAHNQNTTPKAIESTLTRAREKFKQQYQTLLRRECQL